MVSIKRGNGMEEIEFWHSIVRITQVPVESVNSWLCNPFVDSRTYGVSFSMDGEYFAWKFFLKAETSEEAERQGYTFLAYLKELFPGIDGEISVKSITTQLLNENRIFMEIVLPWPHPIEKIFLLKKIINLFEINEGHSIKVYALWQADDTIIKNIEGTKYEREIREDKNFKIKVFLRVRPRYNNKYERQRTVSKLKGFLEYLTTSIRDEKGEGTSPKQARHNTWKRILEGRVFWKNTMNINTGRFLRKIANDIEEDDIPSFVSPDLIDFTIPRDLPIEKAVMVRNESISFSNHSRNMRNSILFGYFERKGVKTNKKIYLNLDSFIHHIFVAGLTGVGKTRFLGFLNDQLTANLPNIGVLTINLLKKDEATLYNADINLKYGDDDLQVPYYIEGENLEKSLEEIAAYLITSLGLKNIIETNMYSTLYSFKKKDGNPPESIKMCFNGLIKWFENPKRKYHDKFQTNILTAIRNRVVKLLSSPILNKTLKLRSKLPSWFIEWKKGRNIFIDLSSCNMTTKRLLCNAIFQMIRTLIPEIKTDELKYVIVLDEANQILEKPSTSHSRDDEFIQKYHLEGIFTGFLRAFRSRGISFVIADQKPSKLFESVYSLPSTQILFRVAQSCSKLFTNDSNEQVEISLQRKRRAIVFDGVNGRKFALHTMDFQYSNSRDTSVKNEERSCPYCNILVDSSANFCSLCGDLIEKEKSVT